MDFLTLFFLYVLLVLLSIFLACLYSGRKQGSASRVVSRVTQAVSCIIPSQVQGAAHRLLHRLFHTRTCTFIALHLISEALVYAEYTWEVLGYCRELEFSRFPLLLPYLLLIVNVVFFVLCSRSDPGLITRDNQAAFLHAYAYDGVMFEKGIECATCQVKKPARSKHCGVCNGCVHRFDHHCIWVNNCVGAFNTHYFLAYLLTLTSMGASIASVTAAFLVQVVLLSNLMLGHYTDDQGQERPVDAQFLVQQLFLSFPRIVFMLGFVLVFSLILASYFCFTLYLAVTNQTSNEWFKSRRCTCSCTQRCSKHRGYRNIYSRGAWRNLREILRPLRRLAKKKR